MRFHADDCAIEPPRRLIRIYMAIGQLYHRTHDFYPKDRISFRLLFFYLN